MSGFDLDIFEFLQSAKWRDIEFPVTKMRASVAHDLVEHKYWGADGARIEDTGLAPWRFSFSIPLINGITPGKAERWSDLYPGQMRRLADAFQQRSSGILQHPEFGKILCKAERFDLDWDAARRGGVDCEISFVEHTVAADLELRDPSPTRGAEAAAGTLDKETVKADLEKLFKDRGIALPAYLQTRTFSFTEAMQKVKAIADYPALMDKRLSGQIEAIKYHADQLEKSVIPARSAKTWPITREAQLLKAVAHGMAENIAATSTRKDIGLFTVPADTTLAGVARQIPETKVGDLIKLNPSLMIQPEILKGTVVRHYVPKRV